MAERGTPTLHFGGVSIGSQAESGERAALLVPLRLGVALPPGVAQRPWPRHPTELVPALPRALYGTREDRGSTSGFRSGHAR